MHLIVIIIEETTLTKKTTLAKTKKAAQMPHMNKDYFRLAKIFYIYYFHTLSECCQKKHFVPSFAFCLVD